MPVTYQALSSSLNVPAKSGQERSFLRRFLDSLLEGRQRKAAVEIAEYLARHPQYRDVHSRQSGRWLERRLPDR
jgi:hypothetical protein